jgi:hypothetical protein
MNAGVKPRPLILAGLLVLIALLVVAAYMPRNLCQPIDIRVASTRNLMEGLVSAIQAFRTDWGEFPPSRFTDEPYDMKKYGGAGLLAYYLMGPKANGWGGEDPQVTPLGGTSGVPYQAYAAGQWKYLVVTEEMRPIRFVDAWKPPKKILYFRAEPGREPLFDVRDNAVDPTCREGFASQEQFELLAKRKGPGGKRVWAREDYLLISAGPDRLFGPVVMPASGDVRPATAQNEAEATCDDIVNF